MAKWQGDKGEYPRKRESGKASKRLKTKIRLVFSRGAEGFLQFAPDSTVPSRLLAFTPSRFPRALTYQLPVTKERATHQFLVALPLSPLALSPFSFASLR